ncbi:acyltransferase domain-containing protein [Streptomyces sp. 71268]|uniref:type I polyketide synthase n=1 Tax=Streptomyces sp. 71268 TaxID=3002640 RepID=UPI0023F7092A|nr:acyltransferase domain-containing protein [Streptomyces sp. 71268]WEV25352.1 acyltransferase domain-containing protein [Streptomyces sp. 71268]
MRTYENVAPIAVVGMACRLPGAAGPGAFWDLLGAGRDAVGPAPAGRWSHQGGAAAGQPERAGYLERVDTFDAEFFGVSPREAAAMDPHQRLMLELCWEATEHSRTHPDHLRAGRTGVFTAAMWDEYAHLTLGHGTVDPYAFAGAQRGVLAGRVSYAMGLTGPSLSVDAGQSSSLVAVHLACESLRRGESTVALVGGVNLIVTPGTTAGARAMGALSADGHCRPFDAGADGYVRGEGGAVVVLKPLASARADGDVVHGLLLGSAVNNDGGGDSLTAPRRAAQEEVLRLAHERAGTDPARVQYVELHGTGTAVGDPVEAAALGAVYGAGRPPGDPLRVGSAKSNVGHLEAAAGLVGLVKTVLSLRHRELPPSPHFTREHPDIPLARLGLRVQAERGPWPHPERPLLAGVSAFGMGGTNCHVVLAQPPGAEPEHGAEDGPEHDAARGPADTAGETDAADAAGETGAVLAGDGARADGPVPWVLTARGSAALRAQAERLREHVAAHPADDHRDIGHALATTRTAFEHRAVVVGRDRDALVSGLAALAAGERDAGLVRGVARDAVRPVLVFPGQGAQWVGMARELLATSPVFARRMARCGEALAPHVDWDFAAAVNGPLDRVDVVQPLLWAVTVSLAELWRSYGVEPAAVVGHSQGEIAAAVVAGALTLEDGARVVALRSRLIGAHLSGHGGMLAVELPHAQARARVAPYADRAAVAVVNGPLSTVVGGEVAALDALAAGCAEDGVRTKRLPMDYASHGPGVAAIGDELLAGLADLAPRPPRVPFYSTVEGRVRPDTEPLDAAYWLRNEREVVDFERITRLLLADGHTVFVEASSHPVLIMGIEETAEAVAEETAKAAGRAGAGGAGRVAVVGSLRRDEGGPDRFLRSVAAAFAAGVPVDWSPALPGARPVDLPTYAFQRTSHWATPVTGHPADADRSGTGHEAPHGADGAAPGTEHGAADTPDTAARGTGHGAPAEPAPSHGARGGDGEAGQPRSPLALLATAPAPEREAALLDLVREHAAAVLGHGTAGDIEPDKSFRDAGLTSLSAVEFRDVLGEATGLSLPSTVLYRHPTPQELARQLHTDLFPHQAQSAASELPDLWADVESLERHLAAGAIDDTVRTRVSERLRNLLWKIDATGPSDGGPVADPAAGDGLASASDDEMFALINKELGIG